MLVTRKKLKEPTPVVWWPRASACLRLSWDEEAWKKEKGEREKKEEREREPGYTGFRKNRIGERRIEEIEVEKKRSRKTVCVYVCMCVCVRVCV